MATAQVDNPRVIGPTDQQIAAVEKEALNALYQYLKSNDPDQLKRAQVAQGTLGSLTRRRATDNAAAALGFQMVRALTSDPAQLADYIRATQPNSPVVRALPHGLALPSDAGRGHAEHGTAQQGKAS